MTPPFQSVLGWLATVGGDGSVLETLPIVGALPAAFSDDLVLGETRVAVRVIVTDDGVGGYLVDVSESDDFPGGSATRDQVHGAATLALAHALGIAPSASLARRLTLSPGGVCSGSERTADPDVCAFVMSRVYDAILGGLQRVWPDAVGAGSCSLGGLVCIENEHGAMIDVLAGGKGALRNENGTSQWTSPILPGWPAGKLAYVEIERLPRPASGGVGARPGGDGVLARYRSLEPARAHVRVDRVSNPPHGVDRAGPPVGARVSLMVGGVARPVPAWGTTDLPAGSTLVVETSGGAGHGFPGYGEIEFDPTQWPGGGSR